MDANINKKTKVISFMNNKGGVGKTTFSGSLAYCYAKADKKILLIDTDGQSNLSTLFGYKPEDEDHETEKLSYLLEGKIKNDSQCDAKDYILTTKFPNIDIIAADQELNDLRYHVGQAITRNKRIYKQITADIKRLNYYDYIFIDTAPQLDLSSLQILLATDYLIIPTTHDEFATQGIEKTIETLNIAHDWGENVQLLGIFFNIMPKNASINSIAYEVMKYIDSHEETKGKAFNSYCEYSEAAKNLSWNKFKRIAYNNKAMVAFDNARKEIEKRIG